MQEIAKASGAPRTPLGELTALPQTPYLVRVGDTPFGTLPPRRFAPRELALGFAPVRIIAYSYATAARYSSGCSDVAVMHVKVA